MIHIGTYSSLTDFIHSGGSLVADFLADDGLIGKQHIYAAVRSEEQAKAISKSGLNVIQLDLSDEKAVLEILLKHESMITTGPLRVT